MGAGGVGRVVRRRKRRSSGRMRTSPRLEGYVCGGEARALGRGRMCMVYGEIDGSRLILALRAPSLLGWHYCLSLLDPGLYASRSFAEHLPTVPF